MAGDRVVQPRYGLGTIVEATDRHTVIDFREHGRRIFATPLLVVNPAPPAIVRRRPTKKGKPVKKKRR